MYETEECAKGVFVCGVGCAVDGHDCESFGTVRRDGRAYRNDYRLLRGPGAECNRDDYKRGDNQSRTTVTGTDGTYRFSLLPPGTYSVKFAANGLKTADVAGVQLAVTEITALDRSLEVGAQTESVTVEATAETLQTASSTLGTVVNSNT